MSVEQCELKKCSRCGCTLLLKYFETNRKGELYKTCNICRIKHREACKRSANNEGYAVIDCACGETITGTSNYKAHVQSDKHRKYLHDQNIKKQQETQTELPDDLKHLIQISNFENRQHDIQITDGKFVCACRCRIAPNSKTIKRHCQTSKHARWLAWVEQGLDPVKEQIEQERKDRERSIQNYWDRCCDREGVPRKKIVLQPKGGILRYKLDVQTISV